MHWFYFHAVGLYDKLGVFVYGNKPGITVALSDARHCPAHGLPSHLPSPDQVNFTVPRARRPMMSPPNDW